MSTKVKVSFLLLSILLLIQKGSGQNLIPNPDFEDSKKCSGAFRHLNAWRNPTWASPDIHRSCIVGGFDHHMGNQYPLSGKIYIGLIYRIKNNKQAQQPSQYQEYIQVELKKELEEGEEYCFCAHLSLADKERMALREFTFALTKRRPKNFLSKKPIEIVQYHSLRYEEGFLDQKERWMRLCEKFKAGGKEKYLTIGRFVPSTKSVEIKDTPIAQGEKGNLWTYYDIYYYIDNVSLHPLEKIDSSECRSERTLPVSMDAPMDSVFSRGSVKKEFELNGLDFKRGSGVRFEEGATDVLDSLATWMKGNSVAVEFRVHTDGRGNTDEKEELSEARGRSIVEYLHEKGVPKERMTFTGMGGKVPIAPNNRLEGRRRNRRVEMEIYW